MVPSTFGIDVHTCDATSRALRDLSARPDPRPVPQIPRGIRETIDHETLLASNLETKRDVNKRTYSAGTNRGISKPNTQVRAVASPSRRAEKKHCVPTENRFKRRVEPQWRKALSFHECALEF
ncbi:hypothetical protein EVAR_43702_1 [Eumeta japonica]|uniref:Uncharacterized protein n=1 Tax=Eumeta variegata TaxID=151549 RepID=A0A4C1WYG1_EUMVA|nr:hypothetical protein EVAR_43702_1 [Eumeta japonica]